MFRRQKKCSVQLLSVLCPWFVSSPLQLVFCVCHFEWPRPMSHNYYIYSSYFDTLCFRGILLWSVSKWLEWSKKDAVEGGVKIKALSAALSSRVTRPSQCSNPDFLTYELSTWSGYTAMYNDQSHELLRTLSWLLFSISTRRSMAPVLFDQPCSGHLGEAEQSRSRDHCWPSRISPVSQQWAMKQWKNIILM